jgi:hypothetical protein
LKVDKDFLGSAPGETVTIRLGTIVCRRGVRVLPVINGTGPRFDFRRLL